MLRPHPRVVATATLLASWLVRAPAQVPDVRSSDLVTVIVYLQTEHPAPPGDPQDAQVDPADRSLTPDARDLRRAERDAGLVARIEAASRSSRDDVVALAARLRGRLVYSLSAVNAVVVQVPPGQIEMLRSAPGVGAVLVDQPREAHLDLTAGSLRVPDVWSAGHTGGAVDVAVVDSGLYVGHSAFASRADAVTSAVFHDSARHMPNYWDLPDSTDDFAGHGTFVAGVVFSQGEPHARARRGMAYGIDRYYNIKAGYLTYPYGGSSLLSDLMAGVDWALTRGDPPEVFNYSYGAYVTTDDDAYTQFWDGVVDTFSKTVTISAGNGGADRISSPGLAYNVISVANIDPMGTSSRSDDVIAESSSGGPTPGGRRKPDLAAPGTNVSMPSHYGALFWQRASGTSFAAPAVAGVAALLIDAGVADPRAVKALLVNTAESLGSEGGWDARAGWGYVNAARAFEERFDVRLLSMPSPGQAPGVRFFERAAPTATKATIAWNRRARYDVGGEPATASLNNIDLWLFEREHGGLRDTSTSLLDNVEQVSSAVPEGAVLALVSAAPFAGHSETVALAHSGGFVPRLGPAIAVTMDRLPPPTPASTFVVSAVVRNSGDLRAFAAEAAIALPPGLALVEGSARQVLGPLDAGGQTRVSWSVRAALTPATASTIVVSARLSGYGLTWELSTTQGILTATGCGYSVTPRTIVLPASVAADTLDIAAPAGCTWDAGSRASWVAVSPAEGAGSGGVALAVEENRGAARSATIEVAGQTIVVTQESAITRTYYLAEGSTRSLFTLDVAITNPNNEAVEAHATFLRPSGPPAEQRYSLAPHSRLTIRVNEVPGLDDTDVSTVIASPSGLPLVVERTMTWDADQYGGHGGSAVEQTSTTWYFAEGAQGFFDTFLLLANPGDVAADVVVRYLREDRPPAQRTVRVDPRSRLTLFAGADENLAGHAFSTVVESDVPIVAERSMYWSRGESFWMGGHESAGATAPSTTWFLAEGATGPFFDDYVLIANPGREPVDLTVRWLLETGEVVETRRVLEAQRRLTINVEHEDPRLADVAVSAAVLATRPVVVERAMYWPGSPDEWQEAHSAFGVTATGARWGLAEGRVGQGAGYETYILLANPTTETAEVRVTFLREQRPPVVTTLFVLPTSRLNVVVSAHPGLTQVPDLQDEAFGAEIEVTNGVGIAVERAMYWNSRGRAWAGGTSVTAIRLP